MTDIDNKDDGFEIQISDDGTIIAPEEDNHFMKCALYVKMYEMVDNNTLEDIAQEFDVNKKTVERWVAKWQVSGLLPRVRKLLFSTLVAPEIQAIGDIVTREWRDVMLRQLKTAKNAKSDKNSLDAATWLYENFVKPRMDDVEADSSHEIKYIEGLHESSYNPLLIGEDEDLDEA